MDGKRLKKRRLEKGLGRQQLARLSGISAGEIAQAENGTLKLRSPQSARIWAALRSS
jgi:transcriptional regulator with XRE-family HTH domain